MEKRVIELIRVSTEGQAAEDRAGIPAQRAANLRTARAFGLTIVQSIEMSDVSGSSVLLAPEITKMLAMIADPEIHGVVAREFSRLMRPENFCDYGMLQTFADTKTILYLPEGPIDFASKTGRLMGTIRAAIAGMDKTEILERIWGAKEEKRRAGKFGQSAVCLPHGVGYEESRGWYYKPEAEKVAEAFHLFLSGETSYVTVGHRLGIEPFNLRNILRNPIYTGWRVIDQKRDTSASARRPKKDGRQGDRLKIKRAPDEIIRVQVIKEGLITESEFDRVQQIMETKRTRHWRSRPDYQHRFTYNGFLTCSQCGRIVHTKFRRDDYYICRGRTLDKCCATHYMRRDVLEPKLDTLFSSRFTDAGFLRELSEEIERRTALVDDGVRLRRLETELMALSQKRERVLDTYFEGLIDSVARSERLAKIDKDTQATQELLLKERPAVALNREAFVQAFSPFYEWEFLGREDKRKILSTIVPEIRIADYKVSDVCWLRGNEVNHTGRGSSQPPT